MVRFERSPDPIRIPQVWGFDVLCLGGRHTTMGVHTKGEGVPFAGLQNVNTLILEPLMTTV